MTGIFNGNVTTGCSYDPLSHSAHRVVDDIVVPGSVGKYPLKMTRYYNSRQQYYAVPGAIGLSPGWAHEYSWLVWTAGHKVVSPHGSVYDDSCGPPVGVSEYWESHPSAGTGTWRLADGGKVVYNGDGQHSGKVTDIYDPYGLRTRIAYNPNNVSRPGERVKVTEPGGRCLWFIYGTQNQGTEWGDGTWLLTRVEAYDRDGSPGTPNHPTGTLIDWVNYAYQAYDPLDPNNPGERRQKMLIGVNYSDGTSATYDYRTDNVHEGGATHKRYPLLSRCADVRYNGPMRTIVYRYHNQYPHGFIADEKSPGINPPVSAISPNGPDTFTETRGDGPTRSFTYTHFGHAPCAPGESCYCEDYAFNDAWPVRAPQQMLKSYTDFQGNTTRVDYDNHWYINWVKDANQNITQYVRGDPPPVGIGEIKRIIPPGGSYPNGAYIEYVYSDHGHYIMSIRDENAHTTAITRDGNHRITWIEYPSDINTPPSHEEFSNFDSFGHPRTHRLRNGAWETFVYDGRGLLTDKYNPKFGSAPGGGDPHTHYEYYTSGPWIDRVKKMTMPANWVGNVASEEYEYDKKSDGTPCAGRGLVTKITYADNRSKSFKYDQWGNKWREWNELGEGTQYAYDGYNRVTSVTNTPTNEVTAYTYNPPGGGSPYLHTTNSPDRVTAPTGIVTSNVYDQNWRKTSSSVAGRTTWFHYDLVGNQDCVTDPRGTGPCSAGYTTRTEYDTRNRKLKVWDAQNHQTTFTYDNANNVTDIQRPDTRHETKTYDAVNRVLTHRVPKDNSTSITTRFHYNPSGTLDWVKDGQNRQYSFEYNDPSDLRTKMTYPDQSSQAWQYDNAHNLGARATVNGKIEFLAYDVRNRKYAEFWYQMPADAEWRYFGYDGANRLRRAKNGTGTWGTNVISDVHRDYDHAGRLTLDKQDITGFGATEVHYQYDKTLRGTDGKPTLMYVNNLGNGYDYDFRYDGMGRFEKIFYHNAGNPWFQYHYDNASNETQRDNLLNHVNQIYNPDELNRPRMVELQHDGTPFAREAYEYWPMGWLHTVTRPNNRQDQFVYYFDGELYVVFYDVTAAEAPDPSESPPAEDPAKAKTVDDLLGLPDGADPEALETAARTVTYLYDKAGNRTFVADTVNGNAYYTANGGGPPNNLNQYEDVGGFAVSNGLEHEIASFKNVTYTYMKDEHLTRVTSGTSNYDLAYDALGRCVKRTVRTQMVGVQQPDVTPRPRPTPYPRPSPPPPSPTPSPSATPPGQVEVTKYYVYDGERPILEYFPNRDLAGYNLYGKRVDEILMRFDPTGPDPQPFYFQQDHEGSVTHLTYNPPAGQTPILEYYRYDVFGAPKIYGPPPWPVRTASLYSNRFLFTGREWSAMFGFYEYRARAYHPGLGRFMSEDPKLFVRSIALGKSAQDGLGKSPDDWSFAAHPDEAEFNLFRYCHNDPINWTDPMGEEGWTDYPRVVWALGFDRQAIKQVREIQREAGAAGQAAEKQAKDNGTFTQTPDIANAVRHLVGSAELTRAVGAEKAKQITDIHEDGAKNKKDSAVDQKHNAVGREIGATSNSKTEVMQKVNETLKTDKVILKIEKEKK